jgi:hypothetical protein
MTTTQVHAVTAPRWHGSAVGFLLRATAVAAVVTASLAIGTPGASAQAAPIPSAPRQISPSGSITTTTPEFTWSPTSSAFTYQLFVSGPSGQAVNEVLFATNVCSGTQCRYKHRTALAPAANYQWWVAAYNTAGLGTWSSGISFYIAPLPLTPPMPTLIAPITRGWWEPLAVASPVYRWHVAGTGATQATKYQLVVQTESNEVATAFGSRLIVNATLPAAQFCFATGRCGAGGGPSLPAGAAYTWFVRAGNSAGWSDWSVGAFWR